MTQSYATTILNEDFKITSLDLDAGNQFGNSVAISGDNVIVGAIANDDAGFNSGSAYIFEKIAGVWTETKKLTASDAAAEDRFGQSVSINADKAIVGAWRNDDAGSDSGSAYIFEKIAGVWTETKKLTASDAEANDLFGTSVSIDGDMAIVGAVFNDDAGSNSGSAYIFEKIAGVWTETKITAPDAAAHDKFGGFVSISDDTVVVGSSNDGNNTFHGSAYVFTKIGTTWTFQEQLLASDTATVEGFGQSGSISGDTIVIGNSSTDEVGTNSGSAYVFTRSGTTWTEQVKLTASDAKHKGQFGQSVGVSGDAVVVGAGGDNHAGLFSGAAYLFTRSGTTWTEQVKLTASDATFIDRFGQSVGVSGDTIVVGASGDGEQSVGGPPNFGSAYLFKLPDTTPPVLVTPADIITEPDDPTGAFVSYTVSATDDQDPTPSVTCEDQDSNPVSITGDNYPIGVTNVTCTAQDSQGNSVQGTFSITVNYAAGKFLFEIGGVQGTGDGQFYHQRGVDAFTSGPNAGSFIVADTNNNRLQIFDRDGNLVTKYGANGGDGTAGSALGEFEGPADVAVNSNTGDIVVSDWSNNRVQIRDGTTGNWALIPSGDGSYSRPSGVAIDQNSGNIIVTEFYGERFQIFDKTGLHITTVGGSGVGFSGPSCGINPPEPPSSFGYTNGVTVDPDSGNIIVGDEYNYQYRVFDETGSFIDCFGPAHFGHSPGAILRSQDIAIDSSGNRIIGTYYQTFPQIYDSNGVFVTYIGTQYPSNLPGDFRHTLYVAVDDTDRVIISDFRNHRIQVFAPFTNPLTFDADGDRIWDQVDAIPATPSTDFADSETTEGTLVSSGGQILTIKDATGPTNGVRITADAAGVAPQAEVSVCGGSATLFLSAGDDIQATCGSVILEVLTGELDVTFVADDQTTGTSTINSGNLLTFEPETFTFTPNPKNQQDITIELDGGGELVIESPTLQAQKSLLAEDLENLKDDAQSSKTEKQLKDAIKALEKSTKDKLWAADGNSLDSKKGDKVFDEEKKAVKHLLKILDKDKESDDFNNNIASIIEKITSIDRDLAENAITETDAFAGDEKADKQIAKANEEFDIALEELNDFNSEDAIKHFKKAWKHAQKAMNQGGDDDDNDEEDEDDVDKED